MIEQLEMERQLVGKATPWTLLREMWTIIGNRKRGTRLDWFDGLSTDDEDEQVGKQGAKKPDGPFFLAA